MAAKWPLCSDSHADGEYALELRIERQLKEGLFPEGDSPFGVYCSRCSASRRTSRTLMLYMLVNSLVLALSSNNKKGDKKGTVLVRWFDELTTGLLTTIVF